MADIVRLKAPGGVEQFEVTSAGLPPPAPDEIRLRQTAIGVNFIDIYQRTGLYPLPARCDPRRRGGWGGHGRRRQREGAERG